MRHLVHLRLNSPFAAPRTAQIVKGLSSKNPRATLIVAAHD